MDPAPADSGIEVQVFISPTHGGTVRVGESDSPPYQATLTVLDGQGTVTQSFQTNVDGTFRVPLPPGDYMLHPELPGP